MKPIYYKCKSNGECFKVVLQDNISQTQLDACLDAVGYKNSQFITEEEFELTCDRFMDLDIFDTTNTYKIGVLTTKYLYIDEIDDYLNNPLKVKAINPKQKKKMKAEELRIGNWIERLDGSIFQVTIHDLHSIYTWTANERLLPNPIPLTEEWLLKFRHEVFDTIRFLGDGYNVWKETPNSRFNLYTVDKKKWVCRIHTHELTEIGYVHQLQNLYFALTGEELTPLK